MSEFWITAGWSAAAIFAAWVVHTRAIGWIPEDAPNGGRKQHARVTPLIGFIPAIVCSTVCWIYAMPWLAAGCAVASLTGFVDDSHKEDGDGIDWRWKGIGLVAAAALGTTQVALDSDASFWALLATFVAVFVLSNAVNFVDNTDGVSTTVGTLGLLLVGGPGIALAGAWIAFLPFNWPRSKLFLGDSGALALGLVLGGLVMRDACVEGSLNWIAMCAPAIVPWVDFVQVVIARVTLGYAPWVADRRHLTHIVQNVGAPSWSVAPAFAAITVLTWWALTPVAS